MGMRDAVLVLCLCLVLASVARAGWADARGRFEVLSEPAGANVEVSPPGDPRFYHKGVTPCEVVVQNPIPGEWAIRVSAPDCIPRTVGGALPSGEVTVRLAPASDDASLEFPIAVESEGEAASVAILAPLGGDPLFRIENATRPAWSPVSPRLACVRDGEVILWWPSGVRRLGTMPRGALSDRIVFTPDGEYLATLVALPAEEDGSPSGLALMCRPVSGGQDRILPLGAVPAGAPDPLDFAVDRMAETVAVAFGPSGDGAHQGSVVLYRLARDRVPEAVELPEGVPAPTAVAFDPVSSALWMLVPMDPSTDRPARAVQYLPYVGIVALQAPPPGAEDLETVDRLAFSPAGRWLAASGHTATGARVVLLPWRVVGAGPVTHGGRLADWARVESAAPAGP